MRRRGCAPGWALLLLLASACSSGGEPDVERPRFTNPVAARSADPWVVRHEDRYYYTYTTGGDVQVCVAEWLQHVQTNCARVWQPPSGTLYSREIWAPELHYLDGVWYIYVAASDGNNENHRMYVLAADTADPQGSYSFKGKISDPTDRWAIDGTVLRHDGRLYFVWSGWEGTENVRQDLYIAPMSNPWTIAGERTRLSTPEHAWERQGLPINEGPEVLQHGGRLFIVYSASGFWEPGYALGLLTHTGGEVTDPASWEKTPAPVFSGEGTTVQGTGHASFTTSCDGTEHWIVYHAHRPADPPDRDLRMQPFTFRADGTPDFGRPVAPGVPLDVPSGCF